MFWSRNQNLPFRSDDFTKYSQDVKKALELIRQTEEESSEFKKHTLDLVVTQHKSLTTQHVSEAVRSSVGDEPFVLEVVETFIDGV